MSRGRLPAPALLAAALPFALLALAPALPARADGGDIGGMPEGFWAESHLSSSNTGPNAFFGLNVNSLVGADRFYAAGYTGSRSVVTVVDGGHIWNGHETLGHVNTFLDARSTYTTNGVSFGSLGQTDRHATWVAHTVGGRPTSSGATNYQGGIAPGATLWSGAVATQYNGTPFTTSWGWSRGYAYTTPFVAAMQTGVAGRRTDVVNGSYGFSGGAGNASGTDIFALAVDGLARANRTTLVFSAGNEGPTSGTLRSPATGYNSIAVGALGPDTADTGAYTTVASFSSRGPADYSGPDGTVAAARARVDICAPGQNMTLAFYGGTTGGNAGGTDPSGGATNFYSFNALGTSFAAPVVSGGAALLCDVAYDRFAANSANATDGNVIKAVLLNSADKLSGWDNGQATQNGVVRTTQALDYAQGAGALNLSRAFDQFTAGVTDVPGTGGGTGLATVGWDWGTVAEGGFNDYFLGTSLLAGDQMTATLNWFINRQYVTTQSGGGIVANEGSFTNLSLQLWSVAGNAPLSLVGESDTAYLNTEHFSFAIPADGFYMLRVNWVGERYDLVGNSAQNYGLAWSNARVAVTVPEAGSAVLAATLIAPGLFIGAVRRRPRGA
jgi:hypothetical protein